MQAASDSAERAAAGIWRREPSVWSTDPSVHEKIANRLGWMTLPAADGRRSPAAARVRGTRQARRLHRRRAAGHGRFEPGARSTSRRARRRPGMAAISRARFHRSRRGARGLHAAADDAVSSGRASRGRRSSPTRWPRIFDSGSRTRGVPRWADHFVAITDEGTELDARARAEGFRDLFINPVRHRRALFGGVVFRPRAGGADGPATWRRSSAWAQAMLAAAEPGFGTAAANPAVALGLAMGAGARAGRDKLTLILPPALEPFGLWVEQLVAESTGKNGHRRSFRSPASRSPSRRPTERTVCSCASGCTGRSTRRCATRRSAR